MNRLYPATLPLVAIAVTALTLAACRQTRCFQRSACCQAPTSMQTPSVPIPPPVAYQPGPPQYVPMEPFVAQPIPMSPIAPAPTSQAIDTQALYASRCAHCHGARGEGGEKVPALIGPGALAKAPTLQALASYIQQTMPPEGQGPRLTQQEAHALATFAWTANGKK